MTDLSTDHLKQNPPKVETVYDCAITACNNSEVARKGPNQSESIPEGWGTVQISPTPESPSKTYLFCHYHLRLVSSGLLQRFSVKEPHATEAEVPPLRSNEDEGREDAGAPSNPE